MEGGRGSASKSPLPFLLITERFLSHVTGWFAAPQGMQLLLTGASFSLIQNKTQRAKIGSYLRKEVSIMKVEQEEKKKKILHYNFSVINSCLTVARPPCMQHLCSW